MCGTHTSTSHYAFTHTIHTRPTGADDHHHTHTHTHTYTQGNRSDVVCRATVPLQKNPPAQTHTRTPSSTLTWNFTLVYPQSGSSEIHLTVMFLCSSGVCVSQWRQRCSGNHRDARLERHTHTLTFKIIFSHTHNEHMLLRRLPSSTTMLTNWCLAGIMINMFTSMLAC